MGRWHIVQAAASTPGPFVAKHNQDDKGLGARRFGDHAELTDTRRFPPVPHQRLRRRGHEERVRELSAHGRERYADLLERLGR
ncbi:hypothetical protein [Ornithinimicrobium sediminis]|uniref:hypothetical protein n=1 Tax=Ornithinimicrobium sediminis TaxID=2904603 RepID=UPI001E40DC43|nr:hypothetical protein [Ornithinimicrobium sediminis]MCE0486541.1 hypothetical protein [Ornithinimicrobium sediminis]